MSWSSGWICRRDYWENVVRLASERHCEFTAEDLIGMEGPRKFFRIRTYSLI